MPSPAQVAPAGTPQDRDGNGAPERWVEYSGAQLVRESRDQDGDGKVDWVGHYGPAGELARSEEDLDRDGWFEIVSRFRGGELAERQSDADGNGVPDRWEHFEGTQLVRQELDRDGDGFRDLVLHYERGELAREDADQNRDGRPDERTEYAGGRMRRRWIDRDGDGRFDVERTFPESGPARDRELGPSEPQ